MLIGIIAVIIFLSILVLVHELGHFLTAKKFGLLVEEFGFGLPPRIWGKKIGETLYSINALPFGGFVKIFGENGENNMAEKPFSKTAVVSPQRGETPLDSQPRSSPKFCFAKLRRDHARSASETFSQKVFPPFPRSFSSLKIWRRMVIIGAGVLMNFLLGWLVISIVFAVGAPQAILITQIFPMSPAEKIGLQVGDRILNTSADNFIKFTNENRGKEITVKIERNGEIKEFFITPRINPPVGEGALGIGLLETGAPKQNIFSSIWEGLKTSIQIIGLVFSTIFNLISQLLTFRGVSLEQVAGPVGIVKATAQAQSLGFSYLFQLLALISLNLVVINIMPFPALDGGRLLFLLIEKIKGSPLPLKFERYANTAGMAILIILMISITIRDIVKF